MEGRKDHDDAAVASVPLVRKDIGWTRPLPAFCRPLSHSGQEDNIPQQVYDRFFSWSLSRPTLLA